MMEHICSHCGCTFRGTATYSNGGWQTLCPECGKPFGVSVPQGSIVMAFASNDEEDAPYANFTDDLHDACISSYYAFSSREDFLKMWEKKVYNEHPDGMWYWVIENDHWITSGGPNPQDIELICDAWGVVTDGSYDIGEMLNTAKAFCKPGTKLYAVDIEWDVDEGEASDLPSRVEIPSDLTDADEISDYISDFTGFCHYGFRLAYKAGDTRYPKDATFHVSGDSKDFWIEDYNVRVSTTATILEMPRKTDKKVLVSLADIDGDTNVFVYIKKTALRPLG